ncbi:MAG TPA: ABC transporter permease [Ohtaekwangia sp.]|nr:ABC transporter permease [Ohtaekwangia sp.]
MYKNYFLISLRNLRKHLSYSVINITGLALGFATCLLLVVWIAEEWSYDRFHKNARNIYRASLEYSYGGQTSKTSVSPTALLPALRKNFAEVQNGVRVYSAGLFRPFIVRHDDKMFQEEKFLYADSSFFQIFSFDLVAGSPDKVLSQPNTLVITTATARKYFGSEDALGKTLRVNDQVDYTITGIVNDPPSNSLLQFDFIGSFASLQASKSQIWGSANYQTFLLLQPDTDLPALAEKTNALVKREVMLGEGHQGDYMIFNYLPLTDIHLKSDMHEMTAVSDIQYLYIFGAIAALVLIIACINYMNLATARAADRAREVGIRKVAGAVRQQLLAQFMGDAVLLTFLGLGAGLFLAILALPVFNLLTGKSFSTEDLFTTQIIAISVGGALLVAFGAGSYPALAMTAFRPVQVLKGNFKTSSKGIWLRQTLVIFQFAISVILIIGTIVVVKQLRFVQNKKLGYGKENVVILPLDHQTQTVYEQLRTDVLRHGNVTTMGRATESPTKIKGGYTLSVDDGTNPVGIAVTAMSVDTGFIPALGMELTSGRNFNEADFEKVEKDTLFAVILNETAVKELMLDPSESLGMRVSLNGRRSEIIGVVSDFHFAPLHEKIAPLVLFNEEAQYSYIFMKFKAGDIMPAMENIRETYKALVPHRPFEYTFLDEQYNALYRNEERMSHIGISFASLAIIIACMGLLGLVAFTASQKTKEIGIRKVLGASVGSIVVLITRDFTRLVLLAILIGLPVAWWLMSGWLNDFAYQTEIGPWPIVIASGICILIAIGTAGFQAAKAAWVNPVDTLRSE